MLLWALPHGALDSAVSLLEHAEALIFQETNKSMMPCYIHMLHIYIHIYIYIYIFKGCRPCRRPRKKKEVRSAAHIRMHVQHAERWCTQHWLPAEFG